MWIYFGRFIFAFKMGLLDLGFDLFLECILCSVCARALAVSANVMDYKGTRVIMGKLSIK